MVRLVLDLLPFAFIIESFPLNLRFRLALKLSNDRMGSDLLADGGTNKSSDLVTWSVNRPVPAKGDEQRMVVRSHSCAVSDEGNASLLG
jgi:hypothetical protein